MNKILVTGGTGDLGSKLVPRLTAAGYDVRVLSRRPKPSNWAAGVAWAQADLDSGVGLETAVSGADQIIHAATLPQPFKSANHAVDVAGTARLLRLAEQEDVKHFLYISIVGIEQIPFFYYKHKLAAEKLVQTSALNWSILRATQFHTFLDILTSGLARMPMMLVPTDFQFQTIDAGEVAEAIVAGLQAGRNGRWSDLAGPQVMTWGEMAQNWLSIRGKRQRVLRLPIPGKVGAGFRAGYNTVPEQPSGTITWQEWLESERPTHIS